MMNFESSKFSKLLAQSETNFSSDKINIFIFILDSSGSMEYNASDVIEGLKMYQESFKDFPESNSIAVSVSKFANNFSPKPFENVREFTIEYNPYGWTALYVSIVEGAKYVKEYAELVTKKTGVIPKITFILFSDGVDNHGNGSEKKAKATISDLNASDVTTVFVAFGDAISSEFGNNMGFQATIEVEKNETLKEFLGVELSKSCKEQSKSMKSLGANFFSQAAGDGNSQGYSQKTAQVMEDKSVWDDI